MNKCLKSSTSKFQLLFLVLGTEYELQGYRKRDKNSYEVMRDDPDCFSFSKLKMLMLLYTCT